MAGVAAGCGDVGGGDRGGGGWHRWLGLVVAWCRVMAGGRILSCWRGIRSARRSRGRGGWRRRGRLWGRRRSRVLGYGDPRGAGELRVALAAYLGRVRGGVSPDQIVVCTGSTQGLALVSRVLAERGVVTVGVEEYSHPVLMRAITSAGLCLRALGVDGGGAVVGSAGGAGRGPPTPGVSVSAGAGAVAWAAGRRLSGGRCVPGG